MLIIFCRAFILFIILLVVIRLMGKRQLGQMEPFELVITLIIADLTCIPMSDRSIPITFGIVAILTMFVIHQVILILSKNSKIQGMLSGKPVMVIDRQGVNVYALRSMNMQVADLLQAIRALGYFSIEELDYGLMETNGQLSVVPNKKMEDVEKKLPIAVILEGKWSQDDIERYAIDRGIIAQILTQHNLKLKNTLLLTVDKNNHIFLQSYKRPYMTFDYRGEKLLNE